MVGMSDPRYPIGRFTRPAALTPDLYNQWLATLEATPAALRAAAGSLNDTQLDTPYREGGWTVRQVVHHLADSHLHAYLRFKLGLTQQQPTINAYDENLTARQADYALPVESSLTLIENAHLHWVTLARSLSNEQLERPIIHPVTGPAAIGMLLGIYAWHGQHHLAHITQIAR